MPKMTKPYRLHLYVYRLVIRTVTERAKCRYWDMGVYCVAMRRNLLTGAIVFTTTTSLRARMDWSVPYTSTFQDERWRICCHLLSTEAIGRLNYNKTVFGRSSARTPLGDHDTLPDSRVGWGGDTSSLSSPLSPRDPRAPRSFSSLILQSYAPPLWAHDDAKIHDYR